MLSRALLPAIGVLIGLIGESWAGIEFFEFSNTSPIEILDNTVSDPYPSAITVAGIPPGQILNVQVFLNGFSHTFPDDTAAVVVAPSGSAALLFSGPGLGIAAADLDWVFDDNAAATLPTDGQLTSGTFRPGLNDYNDVFPAPGPGSNYAFDFSAWLTEDPNGEWRLFVLDGFPPDSGVIAGGWGLRFEVDVVPEPSSLGLLGLSALLILRRRR